MSEKGCVILVGAGPGDPGLLTRKGLEALSQAEVVVYDRLVSREILELIPADARRIDVGKTAGRHPIPQPEINRILLEEAQAGHRVVRLKGGDCFLFGRGGEELELLVQNGIPFQVVPGVTSALAVPAYGGIPVTHRDFCSSVHIITGHKRADGALSLDYEALVRLHGTLVFLMSVSSMGEICRGLIAAGMDENTPAAVIERGTTPAQRKVLAPLSGIEKEAAAAAVSPPAILVVGPVCSLSEELDWFDRLPLKGLRVLLTRDEGAQKRLVPVLEQLGAQVFSAPMIRTVFRDFDPEVLKEPGPVIFTSAAGVEAFQRVLWAQGLDARSLAGKTFAAVGKGTAAALEAMGIRADFIPRVYNGLKMARQMVEEGFLRPGDSPLLLRGNLASRELPNVLEEGGIPCREVVVYDTLPLTPEELPPEFDAAVFTCASCVRSLEKALPEGALTGKTALCIGPRTAEAAREAGMNIQMAEEASADSLITLVKGMTL